MDKEISEKKRKPWLDETMRKRLIIFLACVFLIFIIWLSVAFQQVFYQYVATIASFLETHPVLGSLLFVGLAGISSLLSLFSSVPLVPVAVVVFGDWSTIMFLLVGWMLGGIGTYFIGALAGSTVMCYFISPKEADYYQRQLSRSDSFWWIVAFRLALPAEVTGYTLGIIRYPFGKYVLATFLSELPFALLAVYSSLALIYSHPVIFTLLIAVTVAIIIGTFRWLKPKMRKKS
ncbi:hypothetical protein EPO05_02735 [Patescibacteria group bacterium]|nr:MAG: hypothetical protein EPO05_02735 [Patescibacteria group bacterium]